MLLLLFFTGFSSFTSNSFTSFTSKLSRLRLSLSNILFDFFSSISITSSDIWETSFLLFLKLFDSSCLNKDDMFFFDFDNSYRDSFSLSNSSSWIADSSLFKSLFGLDGDLWSEGALK